MTRVLVVQASPPAANSLSRGMVEDAVAHLRASGDVHEFRFRDIGAQPLAHVNAAFVAARHEASNPALDLSDAVITEWRWAELVLLGSPMHNLSISSGLKAYIDHLMRADQTVRLVIDDQAPMGYEYVGLLTGRRALGLLSRGGRYGAPGAVENDFQRPYLDTIFRALGVEGDFIAVEGPTPADYERSLAAARAAIRAHPWLN